MQDPGEQFGRRLNNRGALDQRNRARHILRQLGARRASGHVTLERSPLLAAESAVHVVTKQDFEFGAGHMATLNRLSTRASSARPRFSRDFTVPSGTFKTCAISRYSSSSRSRRITVSRNSGESFCSAPCNISLASRPASILSVFENVSAFSSKIGACSSKDSVDLSNLVRR